MLSLDPCPSKIKMCPLCIAKQLAFAPCYNESEKKPVLPTLALYYFETKQ